MKKKILFPKKKQMGKRPWGKEELLVLIPKILTLKKLTIKKSNVYLHVGVMPFEGCWIL